MYKVLIADDEPFVRMGLEKMIDWQQFGCLVCGVAENGAEGLDIIKKEKPEIIFTDIKMPEMDGLSMLREAKKILPHSKVIMLTGYREFDYVHEALQLGAFDFLLKPSNMNNINATLSRAVSELWRSENTMLNLSKEELLDGIRWGNEQMVEKSLEKITEFVGQHNFKPNKETKDFFWDIILSINNIRMAEIKIESNHSQNEFGDIEKSHTMFSECDNIADLINLLHSACFSITVRVNKNIGLKVQNIIDYIDKHYAEQISLYDVSENICISTYYASRIFKQKMGKNFVDYLNEVRMEKAKEFLKDVQYKIYEVAELIGIYDAHYFSKIFKKYVGVTPSEYRDKEIDSRGVQ